MRQNRAAVKEPLLQSLFRPILQRALPMLVRMQWLRKLAQPLWTRFPSLKSRLRRAASGPAPSTAFTQLDDAQVRVLLDLRDATQDSRTRP